MPYEMTLIQCFCNMPTSILRVLCMFFRYGLAKTRIHAQPTSSVRFACGQRRPPVDSTGLETPVGHAGSVRTCADAVGAW